MYKKKQRMSTVSMHADPSDPDDFEIAIEDTTILQDEQLHQKICVEQLEKALHTLNDDFKEAIILRDIQQLTYEEISEITGSAMGTVKSRINRGRIQLQEILEEYSLQETF
jgi:RNA polymerase sigma-70 factor (ECF subfamily)